jgi:hypothetical protein
VKEDISASLTPIDMSGSPNHRRLASISALQRPTSLGFTSSDRAQVIGHSAGMQTSDESAEDAARSLQQFSVPRANGQGEKSLPSANANQPSGDEEAVVYSQTRMLIDPTGRLCMQ